MKLSLEKEEVLPTRLLAPVHLVDKRENLTPPTTMKTTSSWDEGWRKLASVTCGLAHHQVETEVGSA